MIPSCVPSESPASERRVFEKLKTAPGTDAWTVFHSLALSSAHTGQFGEIDFLALIPRLGMLCIEVKGGGVTVRNGVWTTTNAQGVTSTLKRSPFSQAKEGMWKLRQALKDRFGRNSTEIKCPIGWMVVLPDIVCPPLSPEFVRQEAIDASDMSGDIAARLAQAPSLLNAASQTGKIVPSEAVCRRIAEFLRPSFERVALESTRAWDADRKLIELSAEQFDVLEGLFDNDCVVVRGAAGTGKTVLALEAARRAAVRANPTQAYPDGYPAWMKKLRQSSGFISSVAMAQALQRPSSVRLAILRKMFLNLAKACSIGSRSGL